MFTKKGLIYFSKTHLLIYTKDTALPLRIEFEEDTIKNMEEINVEWLTQKVKEVTAKTNVKSLNAMMILSKDIVFDKLIDAEEAKAKEDEIKAFLLEIPFSPELIKDREFVKDGNVLITATNKNLYQTIISILNGLDITVSYVIPEIVFSKVDFTKTFLKEVFKQKDLLEHGNFLEEKPESKLDMKVIYIALTVVVVIAGIVGLVIFISNNKKVEQPVETPQPVVEQQVVEEKAVVEEIILIDKKEISVSVYNGTGTPGFAGQVAGTIEGLGYKEIETLNAENYDYTDTIIEKSTNIPNEQIDEIKEALTSYLNSFKVVDLEDSENTINIITGEELTE